MVLWSGRGPGHDAVIAVEDPVDGGLDAEVEAVLSRRVESSVYLFLVSDSCGTWGEF